MNSSFLNQDFFQEWKKDIENLINFKLTEKIINDLESYFLFLIKENKKVNLTSIVDKKDVYYKHFYDSLIVLKSISFNDNIYLCDIGSGAGFPGIVLKIFFPGIYLFIIESNQKKIKFLENLISLIKLKNVFLINKRAEIAIKQLREKFDFVCARAVAHLNILSELSIPFLKINGYFLAWKSTENDETNISLKKINFLGAKIDQEKSILIDNKNYQRSIIFIKKKKTTSLTFPRLFSKIKKEHNLMIKKFIN